MPTLQVFCASVFTPCCRFLSLITSAQQADLQESVLAPCCRFLRVIIVASFKEEARGQKQVVGVQHDLAVLGAELGQVIRGAPSNAHVLRVFQNAAPRKMRTDVWARLRGQQEQLTIQVCCCCQRWRTQHQCSQRCRSQLWRSQRLVVSTLMLS